MGIEAQNPSAAGQHLSSVPEETFAFPPDLDPSLYVVESLPANPTAPEPVNFSSSELKILSKLEWNLADFISLPRQEIATHVMPGSPLPKTARPKRVVRISAMALAQEAAERTQAKAKRVCLLAPPAPVLQLPPPTPQDTYYPADENRAIPEEDRLFNFLSPESKTFDRLTRIILQADILNMPSRETYPAAVFVSRQMPRYEDAALSKALRLGYWKNWLVLENLYRGSSQGISNYLMSL